MKKRLSLLVPLALTTALAGCGRGDADGNKLASLDKELVGNDADPALTSALADQIAVDPTLASQSNRNAVRTPETPTQAQYPAPAPGQPAQKASAPVDGRGCSLDGPFDYNNGWANRLPTALPVFPGARLTEAAGYDRGGCRMRVATFTTNADWRRVLDWYGAQASAAGYAAEQQVRGRDHVLAGSSEKDGSAFYLIATPARGGTEVSLIANNGR